jgi:hypothetical protein
MSAAARRRPAFDPTALGNIDELLPALPAAPPTAAPPVVTRTPTREPPAPTTTQTREIPSHTAATPVRSARKERPAATGDAPAEPAARINAAEVALAPDVYRALRALTLRERATTPTTARSYGQVALDAIDTHADQLATYWHTPPPPTPGLFRRRTADTPRRRRHAQAPARVPLAGVITSDIHQLDELVATWGAGSRSALVEAALRMYLTID